MLHSMTGFGAAELKLGPRRLRVELRSVNHRYCELRLNLPPELQALAAPLEAAIRARIQRGRIDVVLSSSLRLEQAGPPVFDHTRAQAYVDALGAMAAQLGLDGRQVPLTWLADQPGVTVAAAEPEPASKEAILGLLEEGLSDLLSMRGREGQALAAALLSHLGEVRRLAAELQVRVQGAVQDRADRMRARLGALLGDAALDPARLAQEVALLADRSDVTEELERLESHCVQLEALLKGPGAVGRKLDFLLQELNREANTIGSKCSDATMAHRVVDLKAELERMREQIQNVQ